MSRYDLHAHTLYSDGSLSPADLVLRAQAQGVEVLAVTDHDVTQGVAEAQAAAQLLGVQLVAGVEISVTWDGRTIHIVGLGIDTNHSGLQTGLAGLRDFRAWRAEEIGRRLEKKGIPGAYQGAFSRARGGLISRTHFAQYLVAAGHAKDIRQVFKHYLVSGKPGYVPGEWTSLADAVGWIRAAGGQAVIAHPARYRLNVIRLRQLLNEFKTAGGEAIEVVSSTHNRGDQFRFAHLARQFGFLASCGSDFHEPGYAWNELGKLAPLPDTCQPVWQAWEQPPLK